MDYEVYSGINGDIAAYGAARFEPAAAIIGVIYFAMLLLGIAMYIMEAVSLMKMANKTGVRHGWLSFIPIANLYIIGRVADAGTGKRTRTKMIMISYIAMIIVGAFFFGVFSGAIVSAPMADEVPAGFIAPLLISAILILIIAICHAVFLCIAGYHIIDNFGGENSIAYFVGFLLGMFFMPIVSSVLMLVLSFKTPKRTDGVMVNRKRVEPNRP